VARLVDLFESAKAVDEAVSRINGSAPPGEHPPSARGRAYRARLESFSTADPPIPTGQTAFGWPSRHRGRSTRPRSRRCRSTAACRQTGGRYKKKAAPWGSDRRAGLQSGRPRPGGLGRATLMGGSSPAFAPRQSRSAPFEAARNCGHQTIRAEVYVSLSDDEAELIQIDENLVRANLSDAAPVSTKAMRWMRSASFPKATTPGP
jgi:hypothetical protein